jgi:hypothetical protein
MLTLRIPWNQTFISPYAYRNQVDIGVMFGTSDTTHKRQTFYVDNVSFVYVLNDASTYKWVASV